ncbi:MAG: AAA family ATPase, partial [Faecalibacillus sp.]
MKDSIVRLSEITIENFKNVKKGELYFYNKRKNYKASILGLYGQNGSGKTALIDALQLLKYLLCGQSIPTVMTDYINVDADYATLNYTFDILSSKDKYEVFYTCHIKKEEDISEQNLDIDVEKYKKYKLVVFDEILSYSFEGNGEKIRKSAFIDTRTEKVFVPSSKYECLIGKEKETMMNLLVAKKIAENGSKSFVFSRELLNAAKSRKQKDEINRDEEYLRNLNLLKRLILYGNCELFVINTRNAGMISMNALPLAFKIEEEPKVSFGKIMLSLESSIVVSQRTGELVDKVIKDMNIVLESIIPGLTISIKDFGNEAMNDGQIGKRIQLMSCKNSKEIPLKNESEGIKKIISILQLLIVVYNQSSVTVAIDELDSGIFEYLLGEILRIISEKGKGQLIFTSHNLRPLETIDRGFIAFTTTNPFNRYIRMTNVKDNNNLRDFYFRDI